MSLIERSNGDFFRQKVTTSVHQDRLIFFNQVTSGKTVLHYGCADWPIYDVNYNLHYRMCQVSDAVDGFDVDKDTIVQMSESGIFREGSLYYEAPDKKYDFLLIPETIEHVNNVELFLESTLKNADTHTEFLITAPNAFDMSQFNANNDVGDFYIETIHPDHNCWFSVYTLPNFIEKCYKNIGKKVVFSDIGFLQSKSMVYSMFTLEDL